MFDSKQTLTNRLSNAVDLAIDFATLGEYGLEPIEAPAKPCEARDAHLRSMYSLRCRETSCLTPEFKQLRGPRRNDARVRGVRDASMAFRATGAA